MSLTEKIKKLIEVESIRLEIDEFCRQEYNKQFKQTLIQVHIVAGILIKVLILCPLHN